MIKRPHRAIILVAALICTGMGGYLITWSYFRDSLGRLFPSWSQSQLSLPFSLHNVVVCIMMVTAGAMLRKLSGRAVLFLGGLAILLGFGLFPYLPLDNPGAALVMVTILFGLIAAPSVGIGVIAGFDTFLPWFPDRPGAVSGLLTFFCGVAPLPLGALCGVLINGFGVLRAVQIIGIGLAVLIFISLIWAKKPGSDAGLPAPPPKVETNTGTDYSPKEMLTTGTFWCFFAYSLLLRSAGLVVFDLGGTIAVAFGVSTIIGLLFAPLNGVACILGGFIMDRFSAHKVTLLFSIFAAFGGVFLFLGSIFGSALMVITGISCVGFAYGGITVTNVTGTRMFFGMKHYAMNLGIVSVSIGPAAAAVFLAGNLKTSDSFTGIFLLVLIFSILSVVCCCLMFLTERSRKRKLTN